MSLFIWLGCCLFASIKGFEMVLTDFDCAFFNVYSNSIAECDDFVLLRFLKDSDSVDSSEGYSHLMDTYTAFRAGVEFANKMKGLTQ